MLIIRVPNVMECTIVTVMDTICARNAGVKIVRMLIEAAQCSLF
jgi:hypothetical protein